MRASRLVALLLLLQTRGGMTAAELADELEVSVRTVYRDVVALGAAGVPVYAEPGPGGGVRLVDGWRERVTSLTGLTAEEASALFMAGASQPLADLGLGTVLAAAQLKVLAALPPELRSRATRVQERFLLDVPGWFEEVEAAPALATLADALWSDRRVSMRYDRPRGGPVQRTVDPLGLVLKSGVWYLVARHRGSERTYRVSRIVRPRALDQRFVRPDAFDLTAHWAVAGEEFARAILRYPTRIRIRGDAVGRLARALEPVARRLALDGVGDVAPDAWVELDVRMEFLAHAANVVLGMGAGVEVLAPAELRAHVAAVAREQWALYA